MNDTEREGTGVTWQFTRYQLEEEEEREEEEEEVVLVVEKKKTRR